MSKGGYRLPPPPFIGGWQPHAPRKLPPSELAVAVNDPPLSNRAALLAVVAAAWVLPTFAVPMKLPSVVPFLEVQAAADQPAPQSQAVALASWRGDWSVPQRPRQIAAFTASVDDPPFAARPKLRAEAAPWWPAQTARRLPVSVTAVPEDNPPFAAARPVAWAQPTTWTAPAPVKIASLLGVAATDDPPFAKRLAPVQWLPLTWPVTQRLLPPALLAVPEDNPPFSARRSASWTQAATWATQASVKIAPLIAVAAADDPPFRAAPQIPFAAAPWWPAQSALRLTPPSVDAPPPTVRRIIWAAPETWPTQAAAKVASLIPPPPVNDPPFGRRPLPLLWQVANEASSWRAPSKVAPLAGPSFVFGDLNKVKRVARGAGVRIAYTTATIRTAT